MSKILASEIQLLQEQIRDRDYMLLITEQRIIEKDKKIAELEEALDNEMHNRR